jgi:hypothetical protein
MCNGGVALADPTGVFHGTTVATKPFSNMKARSPA